MSPQLPPPALRVLLGLVRLLLVLIALVGVRVLLVLVGGWELLLMLLLLPCRWPLAQRAVRSQRPWRRPLHRRLRPAATGRRVRQ